MRVLYVQPGPGIGGAKVSLVHLLRGMPASQSSQIVLSPPAERQYLDMLDGLVEKVHEGWLPGWQKRAGASLPNRARYALSLLLRGWYLAPSIRLARLIHQEHIDLVHTNSIITPVGALAARLAGRPHIWHIREPVGSDGLYPLSPGDRLAARLLRALSREIICNSHYTAAFFIRHGIRPRVIYNGLDLAQFKGGQERGLELRMEMGVPPGAPVISMVGSIRSQVKEHTLFLQAAAKISEQYPQCRFVVFGGSADLEASAYTRALRDTAASLGLDERLVWAGFVDDVPAMMHSLDVLVHPTSQEGSGRVVMEAMAAGKPVVGVRAGGVQELIQDGATGYLVQPKDATALANSTGQLLADPILRQEMGTRAQFHAQNNYSHKKTADSIQALYTEIIQK